MFVDFLYTKLYSSLFYEFVGVTFPSRCNDQFYRKILNRIRNFFKVKLTTTAPAFCNENTNLGPYLKVWSILFDHCEDRFLSVTHEIGYIDPLAILFESIKPTDLLSRKTCHEFSIACSEFLSKAEFEGNNRFDSKNWFQEFFSKCYLVGEHKQPGTGPTMFLTATFEMIESPLNAPIITNLLPSWQVIRKGGQHFLVSNFRISSILRPNIENDLRTRIDAISRMRLASTLLARKSIRRKFIRKILLRICGGTCIKRNQNWQYLKGGSSKTTDLPY